MFLDTWTMDAMVLAWLALSWLGYPRLVALIGRRRPSIDSSMLAVRKVWMHDMLERDFRVPDTMLMGQVSRASPSSLQARSSSWAPWWELSHKLTASPLSPRGSRPAWQSRRKVSGWRCSP